MSETETEPPPYSIKDLMDWWGDFDTSHHTRQAVQTAYWYWKGYLTCLLNRTPTQTELKRAVKETWEAFRTPK